MIAGRSLTDFWEVSGKPLGGLWQAFGRPLGAPLGPLETQMHPRIFNRLPASCGYLQMANLTYSRWAAGVGKIEYLTTFKLAACPLGYMG